MSMIGGPKRRDPHRNPLNSSCHRHLKRICGTCQHFVAESADAPLYGFGVCSLKSWRLDTGDRRALTCGDWGRRVKV